jgi:glycosyltransferase involved in cell wall biosynthesis
LGILQTPIVAIAYQSFRPTFLGAGFTRWCVEGNDHIMCLSQALKDDLIDEFHLRPERLSVVEWGTDLPFYSMVAPPAEPDTQPLILAIGKTYRDYPTLLKAIAPLNCQLKICCFATAGIQSALELPVNAACYDGALPWQQVLQEYRKAYAIAIPLAEYPAKPKNAVGLTTLLEAMAMGKPVIMTRNDLSHYVVDIEAEGIGLWVKTGDIQGWETALQYLLTNPDVAATMGKKARQLAEQKMNLEVFSQKVATVLKQVQGHHD